MLDVGKGLMSRTYSYLDSYENEDNNNNNKQQPVYKSKDFNIIRKKIEKMYPEQPDVSDYTKVSIFPIIYLAIIFIIILTFTLFSLSYPYL